MSEVELLYKNAGIEPEIYEEPSREVDNDGEISAWYINEIYPPFTAEKQLELIKWLAKTRPIHITFLIDKWVIEGMVRYGKRYDTFEFALSGYVNNIWQALTEEEREQIRSILNG